MINTLNILLSIQAIFFVFVAVAKIKLSPIVLFIALFGYAYLWWKLDELD